MIDPRLRRQYQFLHRYTRGRCVYIEIASIEIRTINDRQRYSRFFQTRDFTQKNLLHFKSRAIPQP